MSTDGYVRRYPNGTPLSVREPEFTRRKTGRLTHAEYDIIDMMRRAGTCDMMVLHPYVGMSYDAAVRMLNRMTHCGITSGAPGSFCVTREGLDAFLEADAWMLYPETRPRLVTVSVPVGRGLRSCKCRPEDVDRVRARMLAEVGGGQMELVS